MVRHQQMLDTIKEFTRFLNAVCQLCLAKYAACNQSVVFGGFFVLVDAVEMVVHISQFLHALADGDTQRFAQLQGTVFIKLVKRLVAAVVDNLQTPYKVPPSITGATSICLLR